MTITLTMKQPKSVYINSDVIFGLFHVLGYQFSPRLADLGESRFWRMDASADYGILNGLARQTINQTLIEQNWDDILIFSRVATISFSKNPGVSCHQWV